jgi:hypothetical protein
LFAFGGFGLFFVFVVVAGHAVLRRARWGAFICHFLIRKWQKGVSVLGRDKAVMRVFYESQVMVGRVAAEPPRRPGRVGPTITWGPQDYRRASRRRKTMLKKERER